MKKEERMDTEHRKFPARINFKGRIYYRGLQSIICRAIGLLFIKKVRGLENIPKNGPFLVIPNHGSFVDFMLVMDSLRPRRFLLFFIKSKYFDKKIWNHFLVQMGQIRADKHSIPRSLRGLKDQVSVVLFAEGTRTRNGNIGDAYPGLGMVGSKSNVPVIPMGIKGAYEFWPWNKKFPNLFYGKKIEIGFGKPLFFQQFDGPDEFSHEVMKQVKKLAK